MNATKAMVDTSCFHCGESCNGRNIRKEEKVFCCEGCKTVYTVLHENGMEHFYQLNDRAGLSQKHQKTLAYAYLDEASIAQQVVDFSDQQSTKVTLLLPQIHCSSCLWLLENLYQLHPGIQNTRVNFISKKASILFHPKQISLRQLVELLAAIGYPPTIRLDHQEASPQKNKANKKLIYQLGLAGFAFGNIMLFSFPEYLGLSPYTPEGFHHWFAWLNITLSIPVLLYAAQDYLRSAWLSLQQKHLTMDVPISLGILTLFFRSLFEIISGTGAGYLDAMAGLVFFLLIGKWFQQKTFQALSFERDFKSYFPLAVQRLDNGGWKAVPVNDLKVGDQIQIRHSEILPADAILRRGSAKIDYSFVTGESLSVTQQIGEKIYAGGKQTKGTLELEVVKKMTQSYLTELWNDQSFQQENRKQQTSAIADRVGKYFTWIILSIALLTLAYWLPQDIGVAFQAFTAVLIIACPCAIALAIPFTYGNGLRILGHRHFYLKEAAIIEKLAQINHIVFDKTGTLTTNQEQAVHFIGTPLSTLEQQWVSSLATQSAHPLSRHITRSMPLKSTLKVVDFLEKVGGGIQAIVDGQLIQLGNRNFTKAPTAIQGDVFLRINNQYRGAFRVAREYRQGLPRLLDRLKGFFQLSLLSGDHDQERAHLQETFGSKSTLFFRQSPQQKLDKIRQWQKDDGQILMIGDGLNDAGALQQADVGIVITEDTNNFTPASDAILDARMLEQLPNLLRFARASVQLIYLAFALAVVYNIVGLSFAVRGALSPVIAAILMPLSSISIVLLCMGGSTWIGKRMLTQKNQK